MHKIALHLSINLIMKNELEIKNNRKVKSFYMQRCSFVLIVVLVFNLFACKNVPNILDANGAVVESIETENLQQVTIGIDAYSEIDKDYPKELDTEQGKSINTINADTKDDTDENIALEEIADDQDKDQNSDASEDNDAETSQDPYIVLDLDADTSTRVVSTSSTTNKSKVSHKKRFIDYEYDTLDPVIVKKVYLNKDYQYATFSVINSGYATLYIVNKKVVPNYKGKVVAVNAGHGVKGGSKKKTFSHPDYTPKVSGGSTKEGAIYSYAISDGMVFLNGVRESVVNLLVAIKLRDKLINEGYTVLMMREDENSRLDNISRIVIANEYADCHLSIHFDSTDKDKGIFYVKPVNNKSFLEMEPLKSNYDNIVKLGNCLIEAFREKNEKIWRNEGILPGDLTQIAFSTNASVDIELGDRASVVDDVRADELADGLLLGIQKFFDLN